MNKKFQVLIYYVSLLAGAVIGNLMLKYYIDYADSLMKIFQEMDKLDFIHGRELFFYLFLKRLKQMVVFSVLFVQFSKKITLVLSECYFAVVEGLFISLCTYYYGMSGILSAFILLLPQFVLFLLIQYAGWKMCDISHEKKSINITKWILVLIVVTIVLTITELAVNFLAKTRIFFHK